jgi:hypothetical protein
MEIIEQKNRERVLYYFFHVILVCWSVLFDFSGGILGWDPVHTTCIFCERSYKNIVKIILLSYNKEFYLFLIRMVFQ